MTPLTINELDTLCRLLDRLTQHPNLPVEVREVVHLRLKAADLRMAWVDDPRLVPPSAPPCSGPSPRPGGSR